MPNYTLFGVPKNVAAGQIAASATVAQGPNQVAARLLLSAPSANTAAVFIGASDTVSTSNGFALNPGQQVEVELVNLNLLWVIAASAQTLTWLATW